LALNTLRGVASFALLAFVAIIGKWTIDHAAYLPTIDLVGAGVACLVLGISAVWMVWGKE
jgi:hypothetical protein